MPENEQQIVATAEEHDIVVVRHDADWSSLYAAEAPMVRRALEPLAVACEHIGSTSVAGLWAKPIVDILVGTSESDPPGKDQLSAMTGLGYVYLGEDGRRLGRFFFRKRNDGLFNVSMVPHGGLLWTDNLMFRDYLRRTPEAVRLCAAVKRRQPRHIRTRCTTTKTPSGQSLKS